MRRILFYRQKGIVTFDSFVAELKLTKLVSDAGLNPEELVLVKQTFEEARTLAKGGKLVAELEKAMADNDLAKVKKLLDETQSATRAQYEITELLEHYIGEELGEGWVEGWGKVEYLTESQKKQYELFVKDEKIVDINGNLYDTSDTGSIHIGKGKSIFVMDENRRIFASKTQDVGRFHHSSLGSGKPIAGVGELVVRDGIVVEISNKSGHYQPTKELNSQVITELKAKGINTDKINITGF